MTIVPSRYDPYTGADPTSYQFLTDAFGAYGAALDRGDTDGTLRDALQLAADTDNAVAGFVGDPGSATGASVQAVITTQVEVEVPPLVVQSLADDDTPAQAAAAAVDTEIANRSLLEQPSNSVTLGQTVLDSVDGLAIDVDVVWGIGASGPYWDDVSVDAGQEALFAIDGGLFGWQLISVTNSFIPSAPEPLPANTTIIGGTP